MAQAHPAADILYLRQHADIAGSAPGAAAEEDGIGALETELQTTLQQLRNALSAVLLGPRSAAKEARQWLISSIAGLELSDPGTKRRRFERFLPGGEACRGGEHAALGRALLELLFETAPREVAALLAQDASLLRHFFKADPRRAPLWFGHFSMEGIGRFQFGAKALALYSLAHRAEMWDLLAWQGRHAQSPVAVAQRPHYFCELDVPRTVRHLIRDCPDFWGSREMRASVEEGAAQLLALDPPFWSKELFSWLEGRGGSGSLARQLRSLVGRCLERGSWRLHCQRLLHLLPQQDLPGFAQGSLDSSPLPASAGSGVQLAAGGGAVAGAGAAASRRATAAAAVPAAAASPPAAAQAQPGAWLVFRSVRWQSLDALLLAAALGCCLPLLLRHLWEDEVADERREVQRLVWELLQLEQPPERQAAARRAHWALRRQLKERMSAAGGEASEQAAAAVELHELLLLHLFSAAFLVRQLSSSGEQRDAHTLESLLAASGFECSLQPAGEQLGSSLFDFEGRRRRRSSSGGKKRKERRRESRKGSKKGSRRSSKGRKKRRRRSRSRSLSRGDSSSDGSSGASDAEGEEEPALGLEDERSRGAAGQDAAQQAWRLGQTLGSGRNAPGPALSSLELSEAVTRATASAYAAWLFG